MNEHLIIEEYDSYLKVTCKENHYITNWDKEDVREYTSAKIMYCPKTVDLSVYYCLTDEEHNAIIEKQMQIVKEEENNKNR